MDTQTPNFLDAIRTRFQAAAGAPWLDSDPGHPADYLQYAGQHYNQIYAGSEPTNGPAPFFRNPRILNLIVTNPNLIPSGGNLNTPVLDFAPVYVESIINDATQTAMVVRFLPRNNTIGGGQPKLTE